MEIHKQRSNNSAAKIGMFFDFGGVSLLLKISIATKKGTFGYRQELCANWFTGLCVNEVSPHLWSCSQRLTPKMGLFDLKTLCSNVMEKSILGFSGSLRS